MELSESQRKRAESIKPEPLEQPAVNLEPLGKGRKKVPEAELEHPAPAEKKKPLKGDDDKQPE